MRMTLSWLAIGFLGYLAGCDSLGGSTGAVGPAGPKGDPGATGPQGPAGSSTVGDGGVLSSSISALVPGAIPGARSAQIEISGVNTHFTASNTTVSFNDTGITVNKVTVGSATNLRVDVDLSTSTMIGAHDITVVTTAVVNGADERLTLQGGLLVQSTLFSDLQSGTTPPTVQQGGLTTVLLRNLDYRENPFDMNTTRPLSGIANLSGLVMPTMPTLDATTFGNLVLVDAKPPLGGLSMGLQTTSAIGQTTNYVSDPADAKAPQVTARTPLVLNAGASLGNQKIAAANTTVLYKYTSPGANYIATINLSGLGTGLQGGVTAAPRVLGQMAPTNGHFADGSPFDTSATVAGTVTARNAVVYLPNLNDDYYFALYTNDLSGSDLHSYSLLLKSAPAMPQSLVEPSPPDAPGTPMVGFALDMPRYSTGGQIDVANESDYIRIQPKAGGGHVTATVSTNNGAMIGVGLYNMDCVGPISAGSALRIAQGSSSQEENLAAGSVYCVRISGPTKTAYQLVISHDL